MSYSLDWTDASSDPTKTPITVNVGTTNSTATSLVLTGKGAANYGEIQQQNLLHLLENFASATEPANPTVGQGWYDTASQTFKVCTTLNPSPNWEPVGGLQVSATAPTSPELGDTWYEPTGPSSGVLYVYTGLGRYPTTATTIGGWEQVHPAVQRVAGRDEYDELREMLELIAGSPTGAYGSGALRTEIAQLTDFVALDQDLRTKFSAQGADAAVFSQIITSSEIVHQAIAANGVFVLNDYSTPIDNRVSGGNSTTGLADQSASFTIYINGVATTITPKAFPAGAFSESAYMLWDSTGTLPSGNAVYPVQLTDAGWQYDNGTSYVPFNPIAGQYLIGRFATYGAESGNTIYPGTRYAIPWGHAVEIVNPGLSALRVEPNSNDWDQLLAAARYALDRLDLPTSFTRYISALPFTLDGRQAPADLLALPSSDVRHISPYRRSSRSGSIIAQSKRFAETINALQAGINNRFSVKGISAESGVNKSFAPTTTVASWGLPANLSFGGGGGGTARMRFRFASYAALYSFLCSGAAIEVVVSHTGGSLAGDTAFAGLLATNKTFRFTADATRIFADTAPLQLSQNIIKKGLWNANLVGTDLVTVSAGAAFITIKTYRDTDPASAIDVEFSMTAGAPCSGLTSLQFNLISFNETWAGGARYLTPLAFTLSDLTISVVAPPPIVAPVANFTVTPSPATGNPAAITLTDTSTNSPTTIEWDFTNDGIYDVTASGGDSRIQNYTPGSYTIRMRATNSAGSSTTTKNLTVNAPAPIPYIYNPIVDYNFGTASYAGWANGTASAQTNGLYSSYLYVQTNSGLPSGTLTFNGTNTGLAWTLYASNVYRIGPIPASFTPYTASGASVAVTATNAAGTVSGNFTYTILQRWIATGVFWGRSSPNPTSGFTTHPSGTPLSLGITWTGGQPDDTVALAGTTSISVISGSIPPGMSLITTATWNSALEVTTGKNLLSGTPNTPGTYSFTIRISYNSNHTATAFSDHSATITIT